MWAVRAILIIAFVVCIVAFAFYNSEAHQKVFVNLIWMQRSDVPLITVVFWSFLTGVVVSFVVFVTGYIKQSVQLRTGRKRIRALESEVTVLRNRPIEESADLIKDGPEAAKVRPMFPERE